MNNPGAEETRSYRNIFKATTLFGGVQVYQILISIIRSKIIAVLLGTAGVGLQGLYQSTLALVQSFSSLGLSQSAVRDVSEANGSGDIDRIGKTISAFRKLVWFTGLLGTILVIVLSPVLSNVTFGNYDYTIPFIVLSFTLLIDQLSSGQKVVLQGLRRIKDLARASAIGATLGLIVSIPIYYVLGIRGIVPTIIVNSITGFIIFWFFSRKISFPKKELTAKQTWTEGKWMVRMGIAMSVSGIFATVISYVIKLFIMRRGGENAVGLYQAGFAIINTYVGMVFTAIGTDFYPRLAAVNQDNAECRKIVSQQGEIATHILAPLLCFCVLLMPVILRILYSNQFLDAGPFVLWCCPGMMFKLASWLIAYQFVAKAEARLFIITEIVGGAIYLTLSLIGYKYGGLMGLGIAFSVNYLIYLVVVYVIAALRYEFTLSKGFIGPFLIQLCIVGSILAMVYILPASARYWFCAPLIAASCFYAIMVLNRKMEVKGILKGGLLGSKQK